MKQISQGTVVYGLISCHHQDFGVTITQLHHCRLSGYKGHTNILGALGLSVNMYYWSILDGDDGYNNDDPEGLNMFVTYREGQYDLFSRYDEEKS
jgi:hypothetical protein